jgi:hypothetical protein
MPQSKRDPDVVARQMGFKSAREYYNWQAAQQRMQAGSAQPSQAAPSSVHELLDSIMALHPAWLLDKVGKKMDEATGGGK